MCILPPVVGYHLIRNGIISDNGKGGICYFGVRIIGNTLERNTLERNTLERNSWNAVAGTQ